MRRGALASIRDDRLSSALEACEQIAAKDRSNLYVASQFFEDRARYDAFIAMYAVMRLVDDFIDNVLDKPRLPGDARRRLNAELDRWERRIRDAYEGRPADEPVDIALAASVRTFPVPLKWWLHFVDAMRFDVDHPRFRDFPEFLAYGEGATVAPAVIYVYLLNSLKEEASGRYLVDDFDFETCGRELGLFAYLAHILRDVARDIRVGEAGLIYLSLEDLRRHDLSDDALRDLIERGASDDRWTALVKDLCARAHAMEARGVPMAESQYARIPPDCAFILCLIITVYSALLRRIESAPGSVLRGEPMMSPSEKAVLAAAAARRTGYPLAMKKTAVEAMAM